MWFVELISRTELERAIFAAGHSIWIGGVMGILLWVCLRLVPARYAVLRYAMTLGALGLLVVSLPATYAVLSRAGGMAPAVVTVSGQPRSSAAPITVAPAIPVALGQPDTGGGHTDWVQIAALIWLVGFAAMLIRMAVQLRGTWRLLDGAQDASHTSAGQTIGRLLERLQWRARLRVLLTPQLNSPAVLGIFRPVLLIPPAIACELTPQQLESILLHELAHIRRYDYLVNIGQLLIEALLFFSPAVWLISRQVRIEREACCDAFAARVTGEPLRYAEALGAVMGRLGSVPATMAATGQGRGTALDRVRRLVVPGYRPGLRLSGAMLTGMVIAGLLLFACLWQVTGVAVAAGGEMGSKATGTVSVAGGDAGSKVQVSIHTRILVVAKRRLPPELFDRANKQWQSGFLDDGQVAALVQSSQQDKGSTVITAPRITVDDGGEASVSVTTPHQYRAAKATTRPDGSQEYTLSVKDDAWDGIKENITAKTDVGHQVTNIRFQLTIQRLLDMEKFQIKPTGASDKPIEYESPLLQIVNMDNDIAVPSGKTAVLGGHILAHEAAQSLIPLAGEDKGGDVERMLIVLVKPTIIGDPSTQPAVPLPQHIGVSAGTVAPSQVATEGAATPPAAVGGPVTVAAENSTTRTSGGDVGKVDLGIIAADNPGDGEYYVGGQVARVGVYSLSGQRQITLKQAVVSAGIDSKTILPGAKVDLIRRLPGNKERITAVDLDAVFKGTQPDRYLQPNDILQVKINPPTTTPVASGKIPPGIIAADNPGEVGEYYMGGHVARGGVYSLTARQITLKQAVVSAGGFDTKNPAGVQAILIRRLPGNKESFSTVDVAGIFQNTQPDYYLQPYDLLLVQSAPQAPAPGQSAASPAMQPVGNGKVTLDIIPADDAGKGEYYLGGHVIRVGVYSLTGRQITVKQAVVSAGGLDNEIPEGAQTLLIRRVPGEKERITPIDLEALFKGTQPDHYLQPNDILQVQVRSNPPATAPAKVSTEPGAVTKPAGAATTMATGKDVQIWVETKCLMIEGTDLGELKARLARNEDFDTTTVSELLQPWQEHRDSFIVTAPRLAVNDGERTSGKVDNVNDVVLPEAPKAGGKPMWLRRYDVGAKLAADKKKLDVDVKLDLLVRRRESVGPGEAAAFVWQPFSLDSKLTVPDGWTRVVGLQTESLAEGRERVSFVLIRPVVVGER